AAQSWADEQDGHGRPAPQRDRERPAIAACELGKLPPDDRAGRDGPMDEGRDQPVRRAVASATGRESRRRQQRLTPPHRNPASHPLQWTRTAHFMPWIGIGRSKYQDWVTRFGKVNEHNA